MPDLLWLLPRDFALDARATFIGSSIGAGIGTGGGQGIMLVMCQPDPGAFA